MEGSLLKEHKFSIIVKKEDLKALNDFICTEYKYIEYAIHTNNGVRYELSSFDDIINYDNYDSKKITQIYIKAQNEKPTRSIIFPDFEISLGDLTNYTTSISYQIRKATEKEIEYRTQKTEELINNFKADYSWLHKNSTIIAIVLFIWMCIAIPLQVYIVEKVETATFFVFIFILSAFAGWIGVRLLDKIISFFFPQTVLCIGKQIDFYERKKKLRQNWLWGIIVTSLVSLLTSILVFFITR